VKLVVVGGGITGLAAACRLEALVPDAELVLVERSERLGGKLLTEREDGFVVESAADSFLSRKPRGVGLAEELGLELVGRRPENTGSYLRHGAALHPLPEGLTGMIPTDLVALERSALLSDEAKRRVAEEADLPPAPPDGDESIASFVTRRLGRDAYERLVEPLLTGIYGGDGDQLSLEATFPQLRKLELEHGSLLRGLAAASPPPSAYPPFVSFRDGMGTLVERLTASLERTRIVTGRAVSGLEPLYEVALDDGERLAADGVVLAVPAFTTAELVASLDAELAEAHAEIPYASSAIVTLAIRAERDLDGYGYVVPRAEGSDVLACTWSSSKWEHRAPPGFALIRVYLGRFGRRDVTADADDALVTAAREELRLAGLDGEPERTWIHRWPLGMPQYVLGHPERLERIEAALARHPGLALAGAAYRGVGIPDCIHSGEEAARSLARSLASVSG
jgi:oxygen-dependent protoporphyrinogen oxidase